MTLSLTQKYKRTHHYQFIIVCFLKLFQYDAKCLQITADMT